MKNTYLVKGSRSLNEAFIEDTVGEVISVGIPRGDKKNMISAQHRRQLNTQLKEEKLNDYSALMVTSIINMERLSLISSKLTPSLLPLFMPMVINPRPAPPLSLSSFFSRCSR